MDWPIERMATVLRARIVTRGGSHQVLRWQNEGLGVKLMLDIDTADDSVRLVVDRLSQTRPNFIGSLILEQAVGVDLGRQYREVSIAFADGRSLALSAGGTIQLYRTS